MANMAELADKLPEHDREHVREIAENVLFMRSKLEETRRDIAGQKIVIPYDNGGGQSGIRANPAFGEYQKLLRTYTATLSELRCILEKSSAVTAPPPLKVSTMVGNSKWSQRRAANR